MTRRSITRPLRRFPTLVVVCAIVFIALYVAVVLLYARGTVSTATSDTAPQEPAAVRLMLSPTEVSAATDRISFDVSVPENERDRLRPGKGGAGDVSVLFTSVGGSSTVAFPADYLDVPQAVHLPTSGEIEQWPFDRHPAKTLVTVSYAGDDGPRAAPGVLQLDARHVPGWVVTLTPTDEGYRLDGQTVLRYEIEVRRATSTIAFGLVLLALMVIMPVLGLTVAIMALRGRRRVEVGFFTWNAGMLFATPMLRNFLPGQPPVGSWVDYLVVLWVIAALVLALFLSVVAWHRWGEPQPRVELDERARAVERNRRRADAQRGTERSRAET
ncbi:MAG: DUF4436 family protein [Actinobacteria bacterium]|nr:DUF4436 family protein [Actinomycetota bacterium]